MMDNLPGALKTAAATVTIAIILFGAKLAAALASGSIGLVSTAVDSGLDLVMSLVVLGSIILARRPADPEHPYGHGKFESVAGLLEAGVLAAVGILVAYVGVQRIQNPEPVLLNTWILAALIASILVGLERGYSLSKSGQEHRSPALTVDAWHYASDAFTATLGLAGAYLAHQGYLWADGASAVLVGAVLAAGSVHVGWQATADLVDRVPPRLRDRVASAIQEVETVEATPQVRVRGSGPDVFVDATVEIPRAMGIERAHDVMDRVENAVREEIGDADITVHAEPVQGRESVATTLEVIASRHPGILGIHEIFVDRIDEALVVDCHLEVDEDLPLEEAHALAQAFEAEVKAEIGELAGARTHIEPVPRHPRQGEDVTDEHADLVDALETIASRDPFKRAGPITVKKASGQLETILTVHMDPSTSLHDAHEAAERLEVDLLSRFQALDRVVIHVEPVGTG